MVIDALGEMKAQMQALLKEGEFESVVLLGNLVCSLSPDSTHLKSRQHHHSMSLLFADALVGMREFKRALVWNMQHAVSNSLFILYDNITIIYVLEILHLVLKFSLRASIIIESGSSAFTRGSRVTV
jgi:hypothetical protein